jgi:hypothetical protein
MLVEVAKEGEAAVLQRAGAVVVLPLEAGDEVVHELGRRGVVTDDDEAGGTEIRASSHSLKVFS